MIELVLPATTHLPCIGGYEEPAQWERLEDGSILARYTRYELFWALACVLDADRWRRLVTETRRYDRLQAEARELRGL